MAKRTCDPTVGSIGRQTYLLGRNGQVVRTRSVPSNPKSTQQVLARNALKTASRMWDGLSEAQRITWREAANNIQTRKRLGMSGPMTGNQLFVKINCALAEIGAEMISAYVDPSSADPQLPTALVITAVSHAAVLKLTAASAPVDGSMLWAAAPTKPGVNRAPQMVCLGTLSSPMSNAIDITTPYVARFGLPVAGQRTLRRRQSQPRRLAGLADHVQRLRAVPRVTTPPAREPPRQNSTPPGRTRHPAGLLRFGPSPVLPDLSPLHWGSSSRDPPAGGPQVARVPGQTTRVSRQPPTPEDAL